MDLDLRDLLELERRQGMSLSLLMYWCYTGFTSTVGPDVVHFWLCLILSSSATEGLQLTMEKMGHVPHPPTTHTPSYACGTWLQRQHCSSLGRKSRSPREGLLGQEILTQEGCWEILPGRLITIVTVVYCINYSQFYFVKRKFRRTSYLAQIIPVSENHILEQ